jgi:hypothetical protein
MPLLALRILCLAAIAFLAFTFIQSWRQTKGGRPAERHCKVRLGRGKPERVQQQP